MHPNGGFGIVFNFGDAVCLDGQALAEPVFLDSVNTVSREMRFRGQVEQVGINFYAGGAYPFLAIPLRELRNQTALLDALDRAPLMLLYEGLNEAKSLSARIHLLEQWLLKRLEAGKKRDAIIPASLAMLRSKKGILPIPALASKFYISQRQLERLYHVQVGMSPKQYTTLLRVAIAREALKQPSMQSNSDLAADLGFYDQSHFIREFSAVEGITPYNYMQRSQQRKR
jgi:AraC-like DNA-binding protein